MFVIIGILIVTGGVLGGYIMEHGNLSVLIQPAELVIIFGAAIGSYFIATPPKTAIGLFKKLPGLFTAKEISKEGYTELLISLYHIFSRMRKDGHLAIESDIEKPGKSGLFKKLISVTSDNTPINFICDNLKVIITTEIPPHELESLMDIEIETLYHEAMTQNMSISKIADAMPGLGLVAAVLGVVLTMGKIDQPPKVIGHSVAAALLGTFLGILMCYGFMGPIATNLEHKAKAQGSLLQIIKISLLAFVQGAAPVIAVEFGRRAIPGEQKPTFEELEKALKGKA